MGKTAKRQNKRAAAMLGAKGGTGAKKKSHAPVSAAASHPEGAEVTKTLPMTRGDRSFAWKRWREAVERTIAPTDGSQSSGGTRQGEPRAWVGV